MAGLQRFFLKLTPILMLLCFVCLGITHTFDPNEQNNITYLTHETINVGTIAEPNNINVYSFDMQSYVENINENTLKRATNKVINLQAYTNTLNRFNMIWDDGYQFGDGVQTAINVGILIINTIIMPINIILTPLRIGAGIILTGISILGININRQTTILTSLNGIIDYANIPMINPTYNREYLDNLNGTEWQFSNTIDLSNKTDAWNMTINVKITSGNGHYKQIIVNKTQNKIIYVDNDNYQIEVYNLSNGWIYQTAKTITIDQNNTLEREDWNNLTALLNTYATEITE